MDKISKQNISKGIAALNNALDSMVLTDMYRAFHPKETKYILFKCPWNILNDRPHDRIQNKPPQIQEI